MPSSSPPIVMQANPGQANPGPAIRPRVVVIHETDGRKYLEALAVLAQRGEIESVTFHGASVLWRLVHALVRDRLPLRRALGMAWKNLRFRLRLPTLRERTVIICVAPWDVRLGWLVALLRGNRIIYNTSWPWWTGERVPRRYGPLTPLMRRVFCAALRQPGVSVVAVTRTAADAVADALPGLRPQVISHVVSDAFFARRARHATPFRLLYVGELSEKKGLRDFLAVGERLGGLIEVAIVGDGPLRDLAEAAARRPGWRWHGRVTDRERLADIVAGCQVLVSLPRRTPGWEELFGMAIAEAMAAGLPCIASNHIGPRGFIRHGRDGYLAEAGDLQSVLGWIRTLRDQPAHWDAIAQAAAATARDFAMAAVSRRWHALLTAPVTAADRLAGAAPVPDAPVPDAQVPEVQVRV